MLIILEETKNDLLVVRASEKLTTKDYEKVFIPKMEEMITQHKKINIVFYCDNTFSGWELGAMWDDAKFGIKHRHDFNKMAAVGAPDWVEWTAKLFSFLVEGEMKFYPDDKLTDAITWAE